MLIQPGRIDGRIARSRSSATFHLPLYGMVEAEIL